MILPMVAMAERGHISLTEIAFWYTISPQSKQAEWKTCICPDWRWDVGETL